MKKRISLICLFIMAFGCQTYAQYISLHTQDTTNPIGDHTLVRSWGRSSTVTYYVTSDYRPKLVFVNHSTGNTKWVYLPDTLFFKDMYIDKTADILYFCGSTSYYSYDAGAYQGYGILGYIDLNYFFNPNIPVYCIVLNQAGYDLSSINKLVEYDRFGVPQIVAIGEKRNTGSSYYMVDCRNITGGTITLNVAQFYTSERYDDILRTNHYVVLMGYCADPSVQSLCYRKTDPYNLSDPMLNDIHLFYNGNDALSLTHSTVMIQDNIASSYLSTNSTGNFVTRIRTINLSSDMNTHSQEFTFSTKSEPDDIIHMPGDSSLVLMQRFEIGTEYSTRFVHISPYPTSSYSSIMEFKEFEFFQSLTPYNTQYYLAALGASWFMKYKTLPPTDYPNTECPIAKPLRIDMCDKLIPYSLYSPIVFTPYPYSPLFETRLVNQSGVIINCSNQ